MSSKYPGDGASEHLPAWMARSDRGLLQGDPQGGVTVDSVIRTLHLRYVQGVQVRELLEAQLQVALKTVERCRADRDRVHAAAEERSDDEEADSRLLTEMGQRVADALMALRSAEQKVSRLQQEIKTVNEFTKSQLRQADYACYFVDSGQFQPGPDTDREPDPERE